MTISWVRRKALKKVSQKHFLMSKAAINPVMVVGVMGMFVAVGLFMVQHTLATRHDATPAQVMPK